MFLEVPKLDNQTDVLVFDGEQSWRQKTQLTTKTKLSKQINISANVIWGPWGWLHCVGYTTGWSFPQHVPCNGNKAMQNVVYCIWLTQQSTGGWFPQLENYNSTSGNKSEFKILQMMYLIIDVWFVFFFYCEFAPSRDKREWWQYLSNDVASATLSS